jgi:hypothetical protein
MRRTGFFCLVMLMATPSAASAVEGTPKGWNTAGSKPYNYEFGLDETVTQKGAKSAYIKFRSTAKDPDGFGTLMQTVAPDAYRGKRVRLSASMKTQDAEAAEMWMRVDGPNARVLSFDNMGDRAVRGTVDWKNYEIVLDVPQESIDVAFGFFLQGKGMVWADAFKVEIVGTDVPVTSRIPLPKAPQNLNFDQ